MFHIHSKYLEQKILAVHTCFSVNESWYIVLFVVSESIKKPLSTDSFNIYLFEIIFAIDPVEKCGVNPH